MIKIILLTIFAALPTIQLSAQKIIKGKVVELHSNAAVPYANIGILNSPIGTISNGDGTFVVNVPDRYLSDTLIFSALGYVRRAVPVMLLNENKNVTIILSQKETMLNEVTVSSTKEKKKQYDLGNRYSKGGLNMSSAEEATAGATVALLIQNKYPSYYADLTYPVFLETAKVRINDNTTGHFKIRVRLYDVDSLTGQPGKDMLNESIVLESDMRRGWLDFDLSKLNLQVSGPFFIAFEWIMDEKDRSALKQVYREFEKLHPENVRDTMIIDGKKVAIRNYVGFLADTSFGVSMLPFSLQNYQTFSRMNSQGEWKRAPYILTARVTVSNQHTSPKQTFEQKRTVTTECHDVNPVCKTKQLCQQFMDEFSVPGMQLTVSVAGRNVLSESLGYADLQNKKPVTPITQFRVGSVSKALTSGAIAKLVSENKLDLDAPVGKYILPQKNFAFTTRQLAGHLAGVRHYNPTDLHELIQHDHYKGMTDALSIFINDSLLFKPGTQYHYSSYGWNLIGAEIEKITGHHYLDYMTTNIWKPLGMTNTCGDVADSVLANKSKFYYATGEEAEKYDLSSKYPSGGLVSTTDDLVKFGNELLHGKYFARKRVEELFQTQYTTDHKPTHYGMGWNIVKDRNGHAVWYHAGNLFEGSAFLVIYPDDDLVIAFLANAPDGLSFDVQKIAALFYAQTRK